ncbi:MAG: molecular chaperone IbpA [Paraglaciecola sp.]|jgi:molecular chaperone IbpA
MRNIDLSPLYRSFIGFDHLATMIDTASRNEKQSTYPPYNIELLAEDKYRITMAIAGFAKDEVSIEVRENTLQVIGTKPARSSAGKSPVGKSDDDKSGEEQERKFLHKGISERNFERKFQLGDHVKVLAADMENGLLHVDLERVVPEEKKPRRIEIGSRLIENG